MAGFNIRALALLAQSNYTPGGTNNVSIHTYGTTDALATVLTDGYFNGARDKAKIKLNDLVMGVAAAGGTGAPFILKFTAVPSSGNVTAALANVSGSDVTPLTDNSGGAATDTIAAITDAPTKNAIASIVAKINSIIG